jgi:ribonucleoside-diphosphate reductase beta chain
LAATLDIVRRVEHAPLAELVSIDVDEVVVQMDHLLRPELDAASFYQRWETQQWAVSDLDFTQDRSDWIALPSGIKENLSRTMHGFFAGEQAVTDTLSPILHAAPLADERIFLATQIADEARHTVFFQRVFKEVMCLSGDVREVAEYLAGQPSTGYRRIFADDLVEDTELVRREPANRVAWVRAVVTYHIVIEAYLALNGQRNTLRLLRRTGLLPAFAAGFTAVARDESRHIGFGVMALRRRIEEEAEMARVIAVRVLELLPTAVATASGRGRRLAVEDPRRLPPDRRTNPVELRDFAVGALSKRLRAIGLSEQTVNGIEAAARGYYEDCWDDYERRFGVTHPARLWERGLVIV